MKQIMASLVAMILVLSCKQKTVDVTKDAEEIMKVDREFSAMSQTEGMKKAFLHYADSAVVLLRSGYFPMRGKDAIEYLQNINDSSFTLTWSPDNAVMALSGDLGYTYGLYTYQSPDTTMQGTYVSIWQKQADGSWKYILDTGNPGVGKNK
jgi:ketosteroid isomerase-like protein